MILGYDFDRVIENVNTKSYLTKYKVDWFKNEVELLKKLRDKSQ